MHAAFLHAKLKAHMHLFGFLYVYVLSAFRHKYMQTYICKIDIFPLLFYC